MFVDSMPSHTKQQMTAVLAILLLTTSVVGPVTAQGGPTDSVLLDSESERIATLDVDGSSYTVYEVDNALPYASGIEIYSNGQEVKNMNEVRPVLSRLAARRTLSDINTSISASPVTSEEAARNQFTAVAWQVSANGLSESDIQRLQSVSDTASRIDGIVSPVLSATNTQLTLFQRMRETGLFGVTAWDIATEAHPNLEQYEQGLQQLQTQLSELNEAAEGVTQNIDPVIESLRQVQQGEDVNYQRLSQQLQQASTSLDQLQSKTDQVASSLSTAHEGADEAAETLQSSRLPNRYVQPLSELSNELDGAASDVESFSSDLGTSSQDLSTMRETASERQQSLMTEWRNERSSAQEQWQTRQSAQTRVFGTLGGGTMTLAALVLLSRRFL